MTLGFFIFVQHGSNRVSAQFGKRQVQHMDGFNEKSGVAALGRATARREAPPGQEHQHGERRVGQGKDPERDVVVEEPLKPVLDEAALVHGGTRLYAEPGFECRERTGLPQPSLSDHDGNGC